MTNYSDPLPPIPEAGARGTSGWVGWVAFAGFMLVLMGTFSVMNGLTAIFREETLRVRKDNLALPADYTTWGWIHIIIGIVVILAGLGCFAGKVWARTVGVVVALITATLNIFYLVATPFLSAGLIFLAFICCLALTVHGSEIRPEGR
ncbi:DUF7144 family membrane protein [Nocardioides taihuensis]|uniref:DUF7144 domain-containing protein n=1 Tax=Nocardioides taihuensis TaxID=1835606 RepID=A0ABW0BJG5_9ACTN